MRTLIQLSALLIAGCSGPAVDVKPTPDPASFESIGNKQDKVDGRVAGALVAIEVNADKPPVVRAESKLAQAYLPKPSDEDVKFALARASAQDEKAYAAQTAFAKKFLEKFEADWKASQDQAKANADQLKKANERISFLEGEVKRVEAEGTKNLFKLIVGGCAAICFLAALGMALASQYVRAATALALGAGLGALPMLYEHPYFMPILIGFTVILLGIGTWFVWDKVKDKINEPSSSQ